ncbi:hypothetical protein [Algoriphagus mannitolivorans]|uniref:hypothetical protein n=1 Tax=Algoriphagus mannitolivorans TaxID=226504 RepID=UPI000414137B|nr:hypothetical protein [Algoriphagus mannitolivorans]
MKTKLYLIPRNFPYFEQSKIDTPFYLVDERTGEVLHFFYKKNNILEDLKKTIKGIKRINWILDSKNIDIEEVLYDQEKWKVVKEKIYSWHERKKESPYLLLIIEKGIFQIEKNKPRFLFDLVNSTTGEIIVSESCSDKSYAIIDLKESLMDIRNEKWEIYGNRYIIKHLSETNISSKEIEKKINIWRRKKSLENSLYYFKINKI